MVTDPPYGVELRPGLAQPSRRQARPGAAGQGRERRPRRLARGLGAVSRATSPMSGTARCMPATVAESLEALRLRDPRADHLGQGPAWCSAAATITGSTSRAGTRCAGRRATGPATASRPRSGRSRAATQDAEHGHGTQKPVECMRRPIENNCSPGQAVYEPFCGSGTTIIAAEMTGRVCHAIELDPAYVDVAVARWQAFTGETATLEANGVQLRRDRGAARCCLRRRSCMAQRGRKPKPVAAKIAAGNPGKRALTHPGAGAGSRRHALPASRCSAMRARWRTGPCTWPMRRRAICRRSTRRCWRGSAWHWPMPMKRTTRSRSWACW